MITIYSYCNSRYYNPAVGRWINADDIGYLDASVENGLNLYVYCGNNPVMNIDPDGNSWWNPFTWSSEAKIIAAVVLIVALAVATVATGGAAGGVAGFILAGALKGAAIGAVSGGLISGTIGGVTSRSWEGFYDGFACGFMTGAVLGGVTGAASNAFKVAKAAQSWTGTSKYSPYKDMVKHYNRHVLGEGQKHIAKNIVNYTKQANQFYGSNSASAYKIGVDAFKIAGSPGGIFTRGGAIKSFWYIPLP